ncbi:hypothetical protein C3747_138g29 [Trypanosoma cruzi]|uniref:RNA-editing substrate-binding complex 7 protein domain-containing protein n=2 Tax=Trypanosoma cruzi TaxID=5693 RepID=Q4DCK7_TRYCC|nr:hypothetical protein, conserved [Trypanosoma cruzi]EAN90257.1 hypothetical protein, conserved [Trypanosoma cruzi]PWV05072.1 hypothetical protein C3747_138g29 [Trypanosoma cruzi]RNC52327.1 hypothetical protein TcCL_ESM10458 [Trypanosoma cruzi]|eukprot:XP_812108.1 hypothetical protein [Trypanosoma cruzi strain CL Brener]
MTFPRLVLRLACARRSLLAPTFPHCQSRASTAFSSDAAFCRQTAKVLYSLERFHRQNSSQNERRKVERQAWRELQKLPDAVADSASIHDVTDIVAAWCYFSRFWALGMHGPEETADEKQKGGVLERNDIDIPLVERRAPKARSPTVDEAPPPRANPLDEVIEF